MERSENRVKLVSIWRNITSGGNIMEQKVKQDISIGRNIRSLRNKSKLTQEQVIAKMQLLGCYISRSSYAKIESGLCNIRVSEMKALKEIFGATWSDFFDEI